GSSRTFMGEEAAGVDAVRIAWEKISAGQGDLFLVGGAFAANRPEILLMFVPYGLLGTTPVPDLWHRPDAGMTLGSAGAFLVMEAPEHARARGARPLAKLGAVASAHSDRTPAAAAAKASKQWARMVARTGGTAPPVLSGACGSGMITRDE